MAIKALPRWSRLGATARLVVAALAAVLSLAVPPARAAFNNTTPRGTFAGTHNYVVTGNTLRRYPNDGTTNTNECQVLTSSSATVTGIPAGSTIAAAYLYWAGSGPTPDASVTFQRSGGSAQSFGADQTFTDNFQTDLNNQHYNLDYFAGFKDVTAQVTGNGTYTFSNLSVATSDNYGGNPDADYCGPAAVIAGWSLIIVYNNPSERYRYTRVYDGLKFFRGSSVTTTQSGFRVPDLIDGKVSIVTWEGDPDAASSVELDGFTESLKFEGHDLINAGCDDADNLYNSTISDPSGACSTSSYGVDIDTYDVTPYLYEGQTGATLDYASGNDLVFLTAQVISTTNTPVADLGIAKTHNGSYFTVGQNGSYAIVVHNYGPEIATGTATVTDTLPTGLTYVSGTGTGWTCSVVGQVVTCNNSQTTLAVGADLPTLTLTVAVGPTAAASTVNSATVSHPMFDGTGGNQTDDDTVQVRSSDLSTSTKAVEDLNGGEVEPGDTLEYTITLHDTGAYGIPATGVSVVDDLAANVGDLQVVGLPAGATDNSIGTGGANGTGQLNISGITVPSGGSVDVVFDVVVSGDADPGETIANTATITSTSGPGATPSSPALTVAASQAPISGGKFLYLRNGSGFTTQMSRTRPSAAGTNATIQEDDDFEDWEMTPAVPTGKTLVVPEAVSGNIVMAATNSRTNRGRDVLIQLRKNDGTVLDEVEHTVVNGATNYTYNFDLSSQPLATRTLGAGEYLVLRIQNTDTNNNREIQVYQCNGGWSASNCSYLTFTTPTVINVDAVGAYSAAYPSTATKAGVWEPGDTVYVRAVVSDPFGDADISNAVVQLTDGAGSPVAVSGWAVKTESPDNPGIKVYEGSYTVPSSPNYGTFTATVTATEGVETSPTITHARSGTFVVAPKALTVTKSHAGDFTAGGNGVYTLTVNNSGGPLAAGTTTTVKDTLATGLGYVSATGTGWTCGAVGQVVTCTTTAAVPTGNLPAITLTVSIAGNMGSSVDNQASVGNSAIASGYQKAGNTDTAIIRHPDLSTSTKSVVDVNFGDANPGDTLRYTITVVESAGYAANNVTVTDTLPFGLTGLAGLNAGLTTCNGTPSVVGSTLTVSGLSLAGGASCTLVFEVQISASAGTGLVIDNTATVSNPNGNGATPDAPVTVAQSQVLTPGSKVLYVYANNTMTRVAQSANATNTINENSYQEFSLPAVSGALTIAPGSTIDIYAWLARSGNTTTTTRSVYAKLFKNGSTQIGSVSLPVSFTSTTSARQHFTITAPASGSAGSLVPGDVLSLRLYNDSGSGGTPRTVQFSQRVTGGATDDDLSIVAISTPTVVHVDSVAVYSAPYPSTSQASAYGTGNTIYVRATVSDPFGASDISGGSIAIRNPGGTTVQSATLANGTHSVSASGATRIYEYAYTIPASPPVGAWTASVTANEGAEGTITHTGSGGFSVGGTVTLKAAWGAGATAGNAVSLAISGGTNAVAGSSTAPSTLTPATSNASTGATITLAESFTSGLAGNYTITLACERDSDHTTITPVGTALSRTITMPADSVTCTWTNSKSVPLTVVKLAMVQSDPVSGTINPKAIPGAIVEYRIIITNPATTAADANTIVIRDPVPANVDLRVADIGAAGSGPVAFIDGSPSSALTYTFASLSSSTDDVEFSNDNGASWTYVPTPNPNGVDPAVTDIRINPKGALAPNNAQFTVKFRVRIE